MKKDSLKKLGLVSVSFALMASPLAFADMHDEDPVDTGTRQESDLNADSASTSTPESNGEGAAISQENGPNTGTTQQSDLDDDGTLTTVEGGGDNAVPGTGEESEPATGTQQQPDLDEE